MLTSLDLEQQQHRRLEMEFERQLGTDDAAQVRNTQHDNLRLVIRHSHADWEQLLFWLSVEGFLRASAPRMELLGVAVLLVEELQLEWVFSPSEVRSGESMVA
jgi:hypothetical protein